MDFAIVKTHKHLLRYIDSLQRRNAESLSFYPLSVFEREAPRGRLFLGLLNGEPCGYIYAGSRRSATLPIHQVCVQYDARRRLYGASLVVAVEEWALQGGCNAIRLRCGFDLDANEFWASLGYTCVGTQEGGVRRSRQINVWGKELQPSLFGLLQTEPAKGKTSAAYWTKHKQTGIVTQFHRGTHLKQYRAIMEESR